MPWIKLHSGPWRALGQNLKWMYEQRDVENRLVSGKRDFCEAVFLLAAHPAQGSLWSISESTITCSCRDRTVVCCSENGIFRRNQTPCCATRLVTRFPSGSGDPEREPCSGNLKFSLIRIDLPGRRDSSCWITHPASGRFTLLPVIQICGAGSMGWHPLWNSTSSWSPMKRISSSCFAEDAVTASRGSYGKETDSFSFTKGWSLAVSAGPVQKKKHWRSHWNNTRHWCRAWRSCPDIQSRKCSPVIFCKKLCKTEKIKNLFVSTTADTAEVIHGRVSSHSFNQEYFTAISCCVDKYSEKPKKLLVFPVFQSVYPLVRMTNLLFYPVRFFFWFAVQ